MTEFMYSTVSVGSRVKVEPGQAASVLESMQARPAWDEVQVAPLEFRLPMLQIAWRAPDGFVLHYFDDSQPFGDLLSQSMSLSQPAVFIDIGGQTQELWPRELFVSFSLAEAGFEHFLTHGVKRPDLAWVGIGRFPRRTLAKKSKEH